MSVRTVKDRMGVIWGETDIGPGAVSRERIGGPEASITRVGGTCEIVDRPRSRPTVSRTAKNIHDVKSFGHPYDKVEFREGLSPVTVTLSSSVWPAIEMSSVSFGARPAMWKGAASSGRQTDPAGRT
jgi:hypothetical protein